MRPVAAPEQPVRRDLRQPVRKRRHVVIGVALPGDSLRAADLGPEIRPFHELAQDAERLLRHAQGWIDAAEMVDYHRGGYRFEPAAQARNLRAVEMQLDEPAQALDAAEYMFEHLLV